MYEIWKLGNVAIADVSWQTCAYVARYCVKKLGDDVSRETFESFGVLPEFSLMSRKPGIAGFYALEHPDLIDKSSRSTFMVFLLNIVIFIEIQVCS